MFVGVEYLEVQCCVGAERLLWEVLQLLLLLEVQQTHQDVEQWREE
jgi:hypothetical protein